MSYRKKNLRGLLFFNICHFNIGFIVLAFVLIVVFSISFTHNNARDSEKVLMDNMSTNVLKKQQDIDSLVKEVLSMGSIKSSVNANERSYLDVIMENREYVKGIGIYDENGVIQKSTLESKDLNRNLDEELIHRIENRGMKQFIKSDEDRTVSVIDSGKDYRGKVNFVVVNLERDFFKTFKNENYTYLILDNNLDLIYSENNKKIEDKQLEKIEEAIESDYRYIYHDENKKDFFTGYINSMPKENINIIVEHNITSGLDFKYWLSYIVIVVTIAIICATLLSFKIFKIMKKNLSCINTMIDNVENGTEDNTIPEKYQMAEWNTVFNRIDGMSKKIRERENQLSIYNKELMQAHDSIESMYVKLKKTEGKNKAQFVKVIASMLNLIELKDKYTGGHSIGVTHYAEILAKEMNTKYGYNIDEDKLIIGSILHDIGKIGIDENILNKPSRLNEEEVKLIKAHPTNGANALADIDDFEVERNIIQFHHEKYDGTGYPSGAKGEDIPIEARLVSVADAFDAMTSDRSYRKAMSIDQALRELINSKGKQFDPKIVDITVTLIKMNKLELYNRNT